MGVYSKLYPWNNRKIYLMTLEIFIKDSYVSQDRVFLKFLTIYVILKMKYCILTKKSLILLKKDSMT